MSRSYICQVEREREREDRLPGPREHVLSEVKYCEPVTLQCLSTSLRLPLYVVQSAVADLEARGILKRWTDNTVTGDSRTFVGTVNQHGLREPMPDEPLVTALGVDSRTVLALLRGRGVESVKRLIRQWPMPIESLFCMAVMLAKLDLIRITRRNGVVSLWANDPGWNWN